MEEEKYKALSKTQLSYCYNISYETLVSWLKPHQEKIGDYRGKAYTPKQIKTIYEILGEPEKL